MKDIKTGLFRVFVFVLICIVVYLVGTSSMSWALFVVTPLLLMGFAYMISKNPGWVLRAGVIGLICGAGFYFAL